jgi:hypothetical protein
LRVKGKARQIIYVRVFDEQVDVYRPVTAFKLADNVLRIDHRGRPIDLVRGGYFSSGLAVAQAGEKFGYPNRAGKITIPARFVDAFPFSDGIAVVYSDEDGGKFGFIDATGREITPIKYSHAEAFSEGFAVVADRDDGPRYFIDRQGRRAFSQDFSAASSFKDGRARVGFCSPGDCF